MGLGSFFKNLFGSAKESAEEIGNKASDIINETVDIAKEAAAPILEKAEEYAEIAKEKASEYSEKASEAIGEAVETVKEKSAPILAKAEEFAEEAKEKISETVETAKEKVNNLMHDGSEDAKETVEITTNRIEEDAD